MVMDLDAVLQRSIAALPTHEPAENAGCKPYRKNHVILHPIPVDDICEQMQAWLPVFCTIG